MMSINKYTLGTIVGAALLGLTKKQIGSYARTKKIQFETITADFQFKKTMTEDTGINQDGGIEYIIIGKISLDEALDQLKTIFKAFKEEVDNSIDRRYRTALEWLEEGNQIPQDWIEENEGIYPETPEGYAESYSIEDSAMYNIYRSAKYSSGLAELEETFPDAYSIWLQFIGSSLTGLYGEKLIPHSIEFSDDSIFEDEVGMRPTTISSTLYAHYPTLRPEHMEMLNRLHKNQFQAIISMVLNLAKDLNLLSPYYDPTKKGFIYVLDGLHGEFIPGISNKKNTAGPRLRKL